MSTEFDITKVVVGIRRTLDSYGFAPRDADPTDFQKGTDSSLRFKVGTKYGEVTVQVWQTGRAVEYLRITTPDHVTRAYNRIERVIAAHDKAVK